jgi:hypothetical protein
MKIWNDDTKFVTQIKWKTWIYNLCHNNVKIKFEN